MWFDENISRLVKERFSIAELESKSDWLRNVGWKIENNSLTLTADIRTVGNLYKVKMVYPPLFPLYPPSVFPADNNLRWSSHQYSSGELCLEWGLDTWNESLTGADMLISARKLLYLENPQTNVFRLIVPSRHILPLGQEIRSSLRRFIIHESTGEFILSLLQKPYYKIIFNFIGSRASMAVSISSIDIPEKEKWENPDIPKELETTSYSLPGVYYKTSLRSADFVITDTAKFREILDKLNLDLTPINDPNNQLLLFSDHENKFHLVSRLDPNNWITFRTITFSHETNETRTGIDFEKFKNIKVGIVGLGSTGSKIAISLARSGVHNFTLFDYDLFLPENLSRHELTWEDVGQHKVDGIKHKLHLIHPQIEVEVQKITLSGQEASSFTTAALKQLTDCNIIIDATADPNVFILLSNASFRFNVPYVWLEIFGGGIGGFIARFRPKKEPHPQKMKAFLNKYFNECGVPALESAGNYSAINAHGNVLVATDSDVSIIAGYATNMALDILLKREPPVFPHSMYLIGLTKGWIFNEPFDTQPLDPYDTNPEECLPLLSDKEIQDALDFINIIRDK